ncbi:alpha/beta hydrolase family protein [Actinoplanes sp. URMC 104]|uniref:alpha/beta hydrolase family protein n=1 Tax=Actinoplanes sp. URMC 104 TaxID=3423409 RepID=UPI003F1C8B12
MDLRGVAAGVPYVAVPPAAGARPDAPVVVAYHLLDAPRTEVAFASALPLDGLDAWRLYLGLPLSGSRLPADGLEPLLTGDAVLKVHEPVAVGAAEELPEAYAVIRARLGLADGVPAGVLGGSMGAVAAQLVAAEKLLDVRAAVLVSPVVRLREAINGIVAAHGMTYPWSPASDRVAQRLDFVARAADLDGVAIRYVTGADDQHDAFVAPVEQAVAELSRRGATVDHHVVPHMAHALAEEPGTGAAPQTPHAATVDRLAVEWFRRHLSR